MKALQCLVLKSGKVVAGFVEEFERVYRVEGFYLEVELTEQMSSGSDAQNRGKIVYAPFSPVGGLVSTLDIPKSNVEGFQQLPTGVMHNMQYMLDAETRNIERKRQLLAMRVPGRAVLTPEEMLAKTAQYVEKNGHLPQAPSSTEDALTRAGVFKVLPTSPYRQQEKEEAK